jgi:hypothetical protein
MSIGVSYNRILGLPASGPGQAMTICNMQRQEGCNGWLTFSMLFLAYQGMPLVASSLLPQRNRASWSKHAG